MGERLRIGLLVGMLLAAIPATASAATHLGVGGSVQQVYVTGAHPGERLALVNRRGATVATLKAGALGGLIFRDVKPGPGYRVRRAGGGAASAAVTVLTARSAPPSTRLYDQRIPASGYGYLTTRDGTKLAIDVRLPAGPGPYPTLVEYSGYGYADPAGAVRAASARSRRCSGSRSSTSTCAGRGARAAPSASSRRSRTLTATTWSRPSPISRGCCATRSGWSASPTAGSASCSSRRPIRPTWPRSRRCR